MPQGGVPFPPAIELMAPGQREFVTKKFAGVAKKFVAEYGLPAEWGVLNLLLDHPEGAVVLEVLAAMGDQWEGRSRVEQQGFGGRLRVLALTSRDLEVQRRAEELLAILQ